MRVAVLGAGGYVGSRLVPELLRRGHAVVATHRRARSTAFPWVGEVEWRPADVLDEDTVVAALAGCDAAVYLVHGLGDADFLTLDRRAADNVRSAVGTAGVGRLVYLSGIVPAVPPERLSDHLRSRLEVEQILAGAAASVLTLRASMVIGAGSTSFEVMRQLSQRLPPVQGVPTWMARTVIQPVAVSDAVHVLAQACERPDVTGHLDVAGPDRMTYAQLMRAYADAARLVRVQLPVWSAPADVVARLARAVVDVPGDVVAALLPSMVHDMVSRRPAGPVLGEPPGGPTPVADALRRALVAYDAGQPERDGAAVGADPLAPSAGDPDWARDRSLWERLGR